MNQTKIQNKLKLLLFVLITFAFGMTFLFIEGCRKSHRSPPPQIKVGFAVLDAINNGVGKVFFIKQKGDTFSFIQVNPVTVQEGTVLSPNYNFASIQRVLQEPGATVFAILALTQGSFTLNGQYVDISKQKMTNGCQGYLIASPQRNTSNLFVWNDNALLFTQLLNKSGVFTQLFSTASCRLLD